MPVHVGQAEVELIHNTARIIMIYITFYIPDLTFTSQQTHSFYLADGIISTECVRK